MDRHLWSLVNDLLSPELVSAAHVAARALVIYIAAVAIVRIGDFPEAERACAEVLSLPLYPELTEDEVRRIAAAVRAAG